MERRIAFKDVQSGSFVTEVFAVLGSVLLSVPVYTWNTCARAWRRRLAAEHLKRVDPAILDDIGLSRKDIDTAVRTGRIPRR